jgi:hypothetical protein
MPINASPLYYAKEKEYLAAQTLEEKLVKLKEMLSLAPKHKSSQNLISELKARIAKYKRLVEKQKSVKKGKFSLSIKKQGAAQITLVGTTNTGKSTLLKNLTNANIKISDVPFTTTKPVRGMLDYKGIKLQIVETPAITENHLETNLGPTNLSIIKQLELIKKELKENDVNIPFILYKEQKNLPNLIWKKLNLIKIHTKQPGKKPTYPPLALKKNSIIKDLAEHVHKDFIKQFKNKNQFSKSKFKFFARVWGRSAKFDGQTVGYNHKLKDDDIVELHLH